MSDRRAGFSLLEVMLAMVALALVTVICYGAFHLGIRAVERGEVAVVTAQRLRVASDVLIRQLKSAVSYPARDPEGLIFAYFDGTETSVSFVTAAALDGGGGLALVNYRIVPGDDGKSQLIMSESKDFSPDSLGDPTYKRAWSNPTLVLDGFDDLRFKYYSPDEDDNEGGPLRLWNGHSEEVMPLAIQVVVAGMPGVETGTWGQEMPVMPVAYGAENAEASDSLPEVPEVSGTGGPPGSPSDTGEAGNDPESGEDTDMSDAADDGLDE